LIQGPRARILRWKGAGTASRGAKGKGPVEVSDRGAIKTMGNPEGGRTNLASSGEKTRIKVLRNKRARKQALTKRGPDIRLARTAVKGKLGGKHERTGDRTILSRVDTTAGIRDWLSVRRKGKSVVATISGKRNGDGNAEPEVKKG